MGAIRPLDDGRKIVIKKADKGPAVLVWDRDDICYRSPTKKQQIETNGHGNL